MKLRNVIAFAIAATIIAGCGRNKSPDFNSVVTQWVGRQFILPDSGLIVLSGSHRVCNTPKFTIINYIDKKGCTSCRMRLSSWKRLLNELDSLSVGNVECIHYIAISDTSRIAGMMRRELYDGVVMIDTANIISRMNPLPEDARFHTFLLDSSGCVIAIGNPIYLSEIRRLYLSLIMGRPYSSAVRGHPKLHITGNSHDFGSVNPGESVSWTTYIVNSSSDTLRVNEVVSSCECTNAMFSPSAVASGDSIRVTITFADTIAGEFIREIELYCNAVDSPIIFELSGIIEP